MRIVWIGALLSYAIITITMLRYPNNNKNSNNNNNSNKTPSNNLTNNTTSSNPVGGGITRLTTKLTNNQLTKLAKPTHTLSKLSKSSNYLPSSLPLAGRADEMTQSSQSRGGIRIKSYHSPFLYILITLILLTILCFTILSIRLSLTNAVEEDTGKATLTNVAITQAGTGQSVTIDGTTMDETKYGSNTTRRTILNNNVVRYSANYQVATPGTITLSITLPANNTIDEATIGTAQGCITGSKLEQVATNGKQSYTNNKATCIMNATSTGQLAWGITAYLWGGNNEQIQPTLSTSGIDQSTKPEPIAVVGKANYRLMFNARADQGFSSGFNHTIYPDIGLYVDESDHNNLSTLLGIAPLDIDSFSITLDTSDLPSDYIIGAVDSNITYADRGMGTSTVVAEKSSDGSTAKFSYSYVATATMRCVWRTGVEYSNDPCFYAGFNALLNLPVISLPSGDSVYYVQA